MLESPQLTIGGLSQPEILRTGLRHGSSIVTRAADNSAVLNAATVT